MFVATAHCCLRTGTIGLDRKRLPELCRTDSELLCALPSASRFFPPNDTGGWSKSRNDGEQSAIAEIRGQLYADTEGSSRPFATGVRCSVHE